MTSPLTITGVPQAAQISAPAGAAVSSASTAPTINTTSNTSQPITTGGSNPGISPRIVVDPLAGVITQFLSNTGQVESQIPSSTVVAYLRAGLQSDGLAKPSSTPKAQSATGAGTSTVA